MSEGDRSSPHRGKIAFKGSCPSLCPSRASPRLFKHVHTRRLRSGADPAWLMITFANQDV
jgi:hypothetical protein